MENAPLVFSVIWLVHQLLNADELVELIKQLCEHNSRSSADVVAQINAREKFKYV